MGGRHEATPHSWRPQRDSSRSSHSVWQWESLPGTHSFTTSNANDAVNEMNFRRIPSLLITLYNFSVTLRVNIPQSCIRVHPGKITANKDKQHLWCRYHSELSTLLRHTQFEPECTYHKPLIYIHKINYDTI